MAEIKQYPVNTQPMVCTCLFIQFLSGWDTQLHFCVFVSSQGTVPMVAGGNKNGLNRPVGPDGKRDWTFGLFDCFDACGLCT